MFTKRNTHRTTDSLTYAHDEQGQQLLRICHGYDVAVSNCGHGGNGPVEAHEIHVTVGECFNINVGIPRPGFFLVTPSRHEAPQACVPVGNNLQRIKFNERGISRVNCISDSKQSPIRFTSMYITCKGNRSGIFQAVGDSKGAFQAYSFPGKTLLPEWFPGTKNKRGENWPKGGRKKKK